MNFLFSDMAEPKPKKRPADELPHDPPPLKAVEPFAGLGESKGEYECFNCAGNHFEVMLEDRGAWQLWCILCGCRQWEEARHRDVFVFRSGRFSGMTLAQIAVHDGGGAYISFMARKADSKKVREACQAWLDRSGAAE